MNVKDNLVSFNALSTTLLAHQKPTRSKRNIFDNPAEKRYVSFGVL